MSDLQGVRLANEHWTWLQTLLEKVYKDAFLHGYKHGTEDSQNESDESPGNKVA